MNQPKKKKLTSDAAQKGTFEGIGLEGKGIYVKCPERRQT
jgi:hypothetical protein